MIFDGDCRYVQINDRQCIPQSTYTIEIQMALLVVKSWIMAQFNSTRSCTVTGKEDVRVDIETRGWVLDTGYEKRDFGNF